MSKAAYKLRQFRSLKEAVNALVNANGGLREAAKLCRVQGASLFRYTDDSDENKERHMPVDIVRILEEKSGVPVVTEFLAEKANCLLLPVVREVLDSNLNVDLADVGKSAAHLFEDWAQAIANDGIVDREEAKTLLRDNLALVRTLLQMRADLEARIADPDTPDKLLTEANKT